MFKILFTFCCRLAKFRQLNNSAFYLILRNFQFRFEFGFSAPSSKLTLADKVNMVRTLSLHYLIYANRAEIDQLMDGLKTLGILQLMQQHPQLFRPLLQSATKPLLTSSQMLKLFQPVWSPNGSNQREKEELVVLNWTTYLDEMQGMFLYQLYKPMDLFWIVR